MLNIVGFYIRQMMATITEKSSVHHCAGHVETTLQQTYRSLVKVAL